MNYKKIHDQIIERAKNRKKPSCYCEKHHIIPKSLGGSNEKSNLVILTGREHFIIHWLLVKIMPCPQMILAFHKMTQSAGKKTNRYVSKSYQYARKYWSKATSERMSGENHHCYGITGEKSIHFGMKRTEETKKLMSEAAKIRVANGIIPRSKRVINIETGKIYRSIHEAQKDTKVGNVSYAVRSGGTANSFHFSFLDDDDNIIQNKSILKGYPKGSDNWSSIKIINTDTGIIFNTSKEAGASINVTGSAIRIAIKKGKKCKGVTFAYI